MRTSMTLTAIALSALLILPLQAGCGKSADPEAPATTEGTPSTEAAPSAQAPAEAAPSLVDEAKKLRTLRDALKATPEKADALLNEAGLTQESLEDLLFQVAADPEASAVFAGGR